MLSASDWRSHRGWFTVKLGMHSSSGRRQHGWRLWIVQAALLCVIGLHSIGFLHKHATAAEHDACVACQVADHQVFDVPDLGGAALSGLWVLLFLVVPRHRGVRLVADSFRRPPCRAPPLSFVS